VAHNALPKASAFVSPTGWIYERPTGASKSTEYSAPPKLLNKESPWSEKVNHRQAQKQKVFCSHIGSPTTGVA